MLDEHAGGGGAGRTLQAVAPDHVGHLLGPAAPPALRRHLSRPRRRRRDVLLHSRRARTRSFFSYAYNSCAIVVIVARTIVVIVLRSSIRLPT